MMKSGEEIHELIRRERRAQKISQDELARVAALTQSALSRVEKGEQTLSFEEAKAMLGRLGFEVTIERKRAHK